MKFKCPTCEIETKHTRHRLTPCGIPEAHIAGSEFLRCEICKTKTYKADKNSSFYTYTYDK